MDQFPENQSPQKRALHRLKNWKPSPEEKAILDQSRSRIGTYSITSMMGTVGITYAIAKYRNIKPLPTFIMISTAAIMGSQLGRLYAVYKGVEKMQRLPNSELGDIIQGFRKDMANQNNPDYIPPPLEVLEQPLTTVDPVKTNQPPLLVGWEKIRQQSNKQTTWDEIRNQQRQKTTTNSDVTYPQEPLRTSSETGTWDQLRTHETEITPKFQPVKNRYGDIME